MSKNNQTNDTAKEVDKPNSNAGPRPGGGHFQLRKRGYAGEQREQSSNTGSTLLSYTNLLTDLDITHTCAIVRNSNTGYALQAVKEKPKLTTPKGRKRAMEQDKEGWLKAEDKEIKAHSRNKPGP